MYTSTPSILTILTLLSAATASPTTRRAAQACTPPSTIPRDIYNFSLRVDGSSEGQAELEINWEQPNFPTSPGHFILSTTEMTSPLLTFLNGNEGGKLCDQGDLCSDLGVKSGDDEFQSFSFDGQDQNALPAFQVSLLALVRDVGDLFSPFLSFFGLGYPFQVEPKFSVRIKS